MAKQPSFPMTIMAGSTAIKIYFSPLSLPGNGVAEPNKNANSTKAKSYDSYVVSYYSGGKRIRSRVNSFTEARDKADAVKASLLNDDSTALKITGQDTLIYARAKNIVSHLEVPLDQMAKEYAEARKALGAVSLQEAVLFYERFGKTVKDVKSVPKIVEELNASLKADGKSAHRMCWAQSDLSSNSPKGAQGKVRYVKPSCSPVISGATRMKIVISLY